jgi:hypothetical protein
MKKTGDVIRDGIMLLAVPLICIVIVSNLLQWYGRSGMGQHRWTVPPIIYDIYPTKQTS